MRRRNKQLENKLATLYVQLKDKDEALKQIHEEYHLTKTNLEKSNMDKGKKTTLGLISNYSHYDTCINMLYL